MSLAFLAKKSWHTTNLNNQEKVWLKQQEQEREKKRVEMLQKQLKEEREMEEMRAASGQPRQTVGPPAGRVPRVLRARACPDWQNRAPAGKVDVDVLATHQPQHRRRLPHGQGEGARAGG